jgi:hypothetical protein
MTSSAITYPNETSRIPGRLEMADKTPFRNGRTPFNFLEASEGATSGANADGADGHGSLLCVEGRSIIGLDEERKRIIHIHHESSVRAGIV